MRRTWIGVGFLLLLLLSSIGVTMLMDRLHAPVAQELEQASQAALRGQELQARTLAQSALTAWKKSEHLRSCFADHTPTEEINAAFAELAAYAGRDPIVFAAACSHLAQKIQAIGEAHSLTWWYVL